MKYFLSLIALSPAAAMANASATVEANVGVHLPNLLNATAVPEIDGGMAVLTVALVGGIATLVKRARDKALSE